MWWESPDPVPTGGGSHWNKSKGGGWSVGVEKRGCPGSAIFWGTISPSGWGAACPAGAVEGGHHMPCLTLSETYALWTVEVASGLTVMKLGF